MTKLQRRGFLLGLLLAGQSVGAAETVSVPDAVSLRDELAAALKGGHPLVVLVSLDGCPFCQSARSSYLNPLRRQDGLSVVQVNMNSAAAVLAVNGSRTTHESLIRGWSIRVAPTLLFLGPGGEEIAERLVGGVPSDFYGAYLGQRLTQARARLIQTGVNKFR